MRADLWKDHLTTGPCVLLDHLHTLGVSLPPTPPATGRRLLACINAARNFSTKMPC